MTETPPPPYGVEKFDNDRDAIRWLVRGTPTYGVTLQCCRCDLLVTAPYGEAVETVTDHFLRVHLNEETEGY